MFPMALHPPPLLLLVTLHSPPAAEGKAFSIVFLAREESSAPLRIEWLNADGTERKKQAAAAVRSAAAGSRRQQQQHPRKCVAGPC